MYKKKYVIVVKNQGFSYNHDEIVDAVYPSRFAPGQPAHNCWEKRRCYSRTEGYPNWAAEFIKNID